MPNKHSTMVYVRNKWPLMLRIKGTVILAIWWQVILIGIYAGIVFVIHHLTSWKMNYSLYWSQMTLCIRNMTRAIWVGVSETETRDLLEKKSAINLLVAFAFATKHYLREEYGYNYDDMLDLISHIPKYSLPTSTQPMDWRNNLPDGLQQQPAQRGPNRTAGFTEKAQTPQAAQLSDSHTAKATRGTRARRHQAKNQSLAFDFLTPTNIPIELSFYIGSYIKSIGDKGHVDAATLSMMTSTLVSMVDCMTGFERILRTPIPLAYSIHLHHATWIYLLALPFQLVGNLEGFMIPAVMFASFTLLGILGIGYEIENPFNDDYNDLPLDDFCKVIEAEVNIMVAHRSPVPSEWIFSENNYPLSNSRLSAKELSEMSLEQVHELMSSEGKSKKSVSYTRPVEGNQNGQSLEEEEAMQSPVPSVAVDMSAGTGLTKVNSRKKNTAEQDVVEASE
ncbi:hypothetical protein BG011_007703 [Mortierella polycephala]|uniref:Uncharacterized protein n=1 Tax=Mortierella polycephala TaxID=41804 RepID=A0A9P6QE78_9FUNG|nr:hypothetical protein BG011_007703 [Mortierella polycephala]